MKFDGMSENSSKMTFEDVYKAHAEKVLNLVFRMTSNEEVSRDLTQDIFIKVYKNLDTFREESQLYTWIHTIAVNHVINYLKREKRGRWLNLTNNEGLDVIQNNRVESSHINQSIPVSADKAMEQNERVRIVRHAIQSLSPRYRIPLILFHYENMSYNEIADMMNLSLSALETRIHRAKRQLIKKLEPLLDQI